MKTPAANRKPAYDQVARIGQEERTYHPGVDRKGAQFLRDVARQFLYNDVMASERLSRHMAGSGSNGPASTWSGPLATP